jgi:hypothetical protein
VDGVAQSVADVLPRHDPVAVALFPASLSKKRRHDLGGGIDEALADGGRRATTTDCLHRRLVCPAPSGVSFSRPSPFMKPILPLPSTMRRNCKEDWARQSSKMHHQTIPRSWLRHLHFHLILVLASADERLAAWHAPGQDVGIL